MSAPVRGDGPAARQTLRPARRPRRALLLALAAVAAGTAGVVALRGTGRGPAPAAEGPPGVPWFADVTAETGLGFVHDPGPVGGYFMPQIMGSGAALFDFDQDGRLDVYLLQGAGPDSPSRNRLFRQGEDGRFTDVSAGSGLDVAGFCTGVAVGDVNNDGRPDVVLTQYGGLRLFLNNGDGTFADATAAAGLEDTRWATSAAFFDYDRDGWLDLVVAHYVDFDGSKPCVYSHGKRDYCHPRWFPGCVTRLYHNAGAGLKPPAPRFEDVTARAGLGDLPGAGLGVVCADFDGDGWPDVFVANDAKPNHLWVNQHNGTFQEEAASRGLAYDGLGRPLGNMGIALGDVDGDGLFDVYVTHLTEETHTLWLQGPRGLYHDRTGPAGLTPPLSRGTGFGTALADFDNDGWPDVAVVNGRVSRGRALGADALGPFWSLYAEHNQLFANDGTGHFRDRARADAAFCRSPGVWRGLAVGDVDNDGAPDLLATSIAGPARLFRNVAPDRGHWLVVRALDPVLKRDAYGAEITLEAGGRGQLRWVNPGSSYQCSNDPRAHFGLGGSAGYDRITVRWPDGTAETFRGGAADRLLTLRKGGGEALKP
jgi:hypothetical protein